MQDVIRNTITQIGTILLGKEHQIKLSLTCLISGGHLLIEDLPGMGKTTLAQALARTLGLSFNRVQFTSDLLPADILGISIFDKESGKFIFHHGPIFSQLILADEINRATPKSQSALLEAMEERQVTIEGETRILPAPFFVIATQNPNTQAGTFPLPESQLDRFLMRIELGYPDPAAERTLMRGEDRRHVLARLQPAMSKSQLIEIQTLSGQVKASEALIDYIQRLVQYTRQSPEFAYGLSPRGALALLHCAKSWALLDDRKHVVPEDVQAVLPGVVEHRLRETADFTGHGGSALAQRLLTKVDIIG
ncbi:MAG: MoxR family ATPase [bacterium]|nr:MoxR family ATPase [Gammaproteobacteria bacterium]HIL96116.1 MoxR family ATPase [Pseudomonadales bacterium]